MTVKAVSTRSCAQRDCREPCSERSERRQGKDRKREERMIKDRINALPMHEEIEVVQADILNKSLDEQALHSSRTKKCLAVECRW